MTTICASRFAANLAHASNKFCDKLLDSKGPFSRQESIKAFFSAMIAAGGAIAVPTPDTAVKKLVGVGIVLGGSESAAHFLSTSDETQESIRKLVKQYRKEGIALKKDTYGQVKKMQHQLKNFFISLDVDQRERLALVLEDEPFSECKTEEELLKKLYTSLLLSEKQRNLLDAASVIFSAKEEEMRGLLILSRFFSVEEKGEWAVFQEALQLTATQQQILDVFKEMLNQGNNKDVVYLLTESYLQTEICTKTNNFLENKVGAQNTIFIAMPLYSLFGIFQNTHSLFSFFHWGSLFTALAATANLAYQHFFSKIPAEIRLEASQLKELNLIFDVATDHLDLLAQ